MEQRKRFGFTLIELMIVVAIIAVLSMIAMPSFMRFLAKAKRAEAHMNLNVLYTAQKAYWAENNAYSSKLTGSDSIGWKPEGKHYYTYGLPGAQGVNYFAGSLGAPASALSSGFASKDKFLMVAAGDIDGDGQPDILGINEFGEIITVKDDLI